LTTGLGPKFPVMKTLPRHAKIRLQKNEISKIAFLSAGLVFLLSLIFVVTFVNATTYSVTVATNAPSYTRGETVGVNGTVSPAPTNSGTYVGISILEPNGETADANEFPVSVGTGQYNGSFVTGGPTFSSNGTYTVDANYNGSTASTTFQYGVVMVKVSANKMIYCCNETIKVKGSVTPSPEFKDTYVLVTIANQKGKIVDENIFRVSSSTGLYSGTFVAGGKGFTRNQYFTVTASYNGSTASTMFFYRT
jgi:hypothetical protein